MRRRGAADEGGDLSKCEVSHWHIVRGQRGGLNTKPRKHAECNIFCFAGLSFITLCMEVKLLDLTHQNLNIRREVRNAIDEVCDSQHFILGPVVERFEKNLAAYCNTRHAIGL